MTLSDNCGFLFVDDEPLLVAATDRMAARSLRSTDLTHHSLLVGADPRRASDSITRVEPSEVADAIMQLRPRVVMSDFQMPGIDGLQVLDSIRAIDPTWLQARQEVLQSGRIDRRRLLFMIVSGAITDQQKIKPTQTAYERGDLAFMLVKPSPITEILPLLIKGLEERLSDEELAVIQHHNAKGIKDLLGLR